MRIYEAAKHGFKYAIVLHANVLKKTANQYAGILRKEIGRGAGGIRCILLTTECTIFIILLTLNYSDYNQVATQ